MPVESQNISNKLSAAQRTVLPVAEDSSEVLLGRLQKILIHKRGAGEDIQVGLGTQKEYCTDQGKRA